MKTRQLLSVGIDIGTTTTQVIFSRLELVNRAAVSQVPRYEFIKREISWQSPVFFTPVDKQGGLKEAELKALILAQYQAAGVAPESVDSGAIIITGESAKTRNARPAVISLSQSLGDFVVASAGPHLESVIAGHGAGAQTLSEQRLCRVLNIDIGGGTANYALFDAGKVSGTACLNVGGRLLETDAQGHVVHAHQPGQIIVDAVFGPGTRALALTAGQLAQVARRMAELIVEVIDGTLSPLAQRLMQTGLLPAGALPEVITLSGGVGECYRNQPADPFCFSDIGPLLATALHEHPRLQEMNVQFPAQTVRATVIGAGAHTLSLSGSTIWLEGVQLPLRNLPVAIPLDEADLLSAWQQALMQLDLDPGSDAYVLALPASLPVRYAALLVVIDALLAFVARFPNPHPLLVVAEQDFGKALGMLLRPQLQQLPLAVIDEVSVRAGDYIDIGTPLFGGSVVPVTTLFGNVYQFKDVKEVLAKANELRSGDVLAGVAAESSQQRVAAKQVLSDMTVADIRNNPVIPYEEDCVTRLIQDDVNETAYQRIKNWTISDLREYVLNDEVTSDDIAFVRKGLTSEVVAAVAKVCSNADLIYGAKKMPVIKKANTTIGLPGTFSCRLQPNDTRDDVQSIAAQIYEGLSFGAGDAVIGVNPVTDDVENLTRVLDTVYGVIDKFNIPTQGCVLAHVTTQIEAIRRGAPGGLIFQSICGSEKGLKEFGVELAMLDEARAVGAEFNRIAGENCLYFETGQGSALSAGANFGADQVTMEARNYGLARHYDPFLVNTVVGFIGPEYLYNDRQIIRAGLEDHFMGKLSGISMGCDCCYTNHADADQNLNENLMILLATAGCNYIMGMPLGDDIMLNYQTTAFHDTATVRQLLNLRPSPEFERWLETMGIMANGRLTQRAGDPSLFF